MLGLARFTIEILFPARRRFAALLLIGVAAGLSLAGVLGTLPTLAPGDQQPATAVERSADGTPAAGDSATATGVDEAIQGVAPFAADGSPFAALADPAPTSTPGPLRPSKHTVKDGETLIAIADGYGLRPETLVWANDLDDADLIVAGQGLVIPPADGLFYSVQPGDGLGDIVGHYGLELAPVVAANGIADPDLVRAGETLFLPGARPRAPAGPVVAAPAGPAGQVTAPVESLPITAELQSVLDATWQRTTTDTQLFTTAGPDGRPLGRLPAGVRLERTGGLTGRRLPVRDPGDGQARLAMSGWVDALALAPSAPPSPRELPRSYPDNTRMDIPQVFAPYRSQLDGSAYAAANCGPTTLSMALAALGIEASPGVLRPPVLNAQRMWGNNIGSLITALAQVAERYGARPIGLRDDGGGIRRWSLDDLRSELREKRPIVVQVSYRRLPGREGAAFYGDHYILLTGLLDDGFLYNDSINSDGLGWDRVISGARLYEAMNATDRRYAYAAFAVSR